MVVSAATNLSNLLTMWDKQDLMGDNGHKKKRNSELKLNYSALVESIRLLSNFQISFAIGIFISVTMSIRHLKPYYMSLLIILGDRSIIACLNVTIPVVFGFS